MTSSLETYLAELTRELHTRGLDDTPIVEEARGHLTDSAERATERGLSRDAAERDAISRFGTPAVIARQFAAERYRTRDLAVGVTAAAMGIAIAYVNAGPVWNATASLAILIAAGLCGFVAPQRPWRWGLALGICLPIFGVPDRFGGMFIPAWVVMAFFPFAGAIHGMLARRLVSRRRTAHRGVHAHFHDRQFHFAMKSKRGWVNPEVLAIAANPGTELVPFVERVAPRPLLPLGPVQSIDVLEDSARLKRYRVQFGTNPQITCTVMLRPDGKGIALDWPDRNSAERTERCGDNGLTRRPRDTETRGGSGR
jgi:hypothetical protein